MSETLANHDPHLADISLHVNKTWNPNHVRRGGPELVQPYLFKAMSAVADVPMPFAVKQRLVEGDVAQGFGVEMDDVEALNSRKIIFDAQGEFGYVVGETKLDSARHRESQRPQVLHLFGIGMNDAVMFFGKCRPLVMSLRPLTSEEARQIMGVEMTGEPDLKCTAFQMVEDGSEDQVRQALARSERIGGGQFEPKSTVG
ncbi:hypothetical protein FRC01_001640 [Tulasnella sp. 417]|nr:hypothetical protein FRC01_001640 [Tulasnella sp. 417]